MLVLQYLNNDIKVVGNISGSSFDGTGLISGAAQITAFGNLEIANPTISGNLVSEDVVRFTGLSSTKFRSNCGDDKWF